MADEDDEFGDFGGFEAADPISTAVTASIPASPSPWAVFTQAPSGVPSETTVSSIISQVQSVQGDVSDQASSSGATDSEDPQADRPIADVSLYYEDRSSALNLCGENEETMAPTSLRELDTWAQGDRSTQDTQSKAAAETWLENLTSVPTNSATPEGDTSTESAPQEEPSTNPYYEDQIKSARSEKDRLEKELESLRHKQTSAESDLAACQAELAEQKQKYQDIQVKHSSELESMRQAGMDALALIVEEYKELCKVTVIEQQAASERQLKSTLEALTEQCQQTLEEQHARHLASLEEEKSKHDAALAEALADEKQNQQAKFEEAIEQENNSLREHISESMQKQNKENEQSLISAVEKLKAENESVLSEQKMWLGEEMNERLEVMKSAVMSDLSEKQKQAEASFRQTMDEDREKLKDQFRLLSEKSREDTLEFVKENKQADGVVRQRQLSSLQLFLETARSQVTDLMSEVSRDQQLPGSANR